MNTLHLTKREIPCIFADDSSYPLIKKWGKNIDRLWWHPISAKQFEMYGLNNVKVGERIRFILNKKSTGNVVFAGIAMYEELKHFYGDMRVRLPYNAKIEYLVLVRKIDV
jgi:hypothetical protein